MPLLLIGPGTFRFLLALLVVVEHVSRFQVGKVAVMVFFMLSGYWVTRVYRDRYVHYPNGTAVFYLARFLRIWPMFALVAVLSVLAQVLLGRPADPDLLVSAPIFGVATHGIDPVGVTWSLDIELQFYLILPLLLALSGDLSTTAGRVMTALGVAGLWIVGAALSRQAGIETVFHYLPMFVIGILIHLRNWHMSARLAWASVGLFVLFAAGAAALPGFRGYVLYGSGNTFNDHSFAMIWAVCLVPFVIFNLRQASGTMDRHLGQLSYTLYLVHFPVILVARQLTGGDQSDAGRLMNAAVSLGLAVVLYLLVDRVLNAQRRQIMDWVTSTRFLRGDPSPNRRS